MENKNTAHQQKQILVGTAHPTLMLSNKPLMLHEEIGIYTKCFTDYLIMHCKNIKSSNITLQTWVGYDMDRHPHERTGMFTYTFLSHMHATLTAYNKIDKDIKLQNYITNIEVSLSSIQKTFNKGDHISPISLSLYLQNAAKILSDNQTMSELKTNEKTKDIFEIYNIFGPQGQYRISSSDLQNEDGQKKIKMRLEEIKMIYDIFQYNPISEIIIADCNGKDDIISLQKIITQSFCVFNYNAIAITPLIEENIGCDNIVNLLWISNKIMLAGSDSVQRETFVGALLLKLQVQTLVDKINNNRDDNSEKIIFFEGVGSTAARSGVDTTKTVLNNIQYERTIQGQQYYKFLTDKTYHDYFIKNILNSPRLPNDPILIKKGSDVLQSILNNISKKQIEFQKEPQYSQNFNAQKIISLTNKHIPLCGSRAKKIDENGNLSIKSLRAITQSFIHKNIGFQPEMLFWNNISSDIIKDIKDNINNPIITTFINHYIEIYKMCDIEKASQFIQNKSALRQLIDGLNGFKSMLNEIGLGDKILNNDDKNFNRHNRSKSLGDNENNLPKLNLQHLSQEEHQKLHARYLQDSTGLTKFSPHIDLLSQDTGYFAEGIG